MATIGEVEGVLRLRDEFTATLVKAQTQLKQSGENAARIGASMTQAGSAMTRSITLPLVALGGVAIKTFSDFDSAMTKSTAIMGDLSDTMKNDMAEAAKEVALTTTFSAKAAAESFFFLASAGLSAEAQLAALPVVSQFAQAGMFDMALATDLLTDAQSALGMTIRDDAVANMENMIRVSDVLAKANVLANATIQQFSESLTNQAGASLKVFRKDVEEGVAILAAFADQGVKGQVAGSGLSRIMKLLSMSAVKNKEALEEYNIEIMDSQGNMKNFADILGDMEVAFSSMSDVQRATALDALGFKARVQGVILPLLGSSDAIRQYEASLRVAQGTTEEIAKNQLESFASKMGLLKDRVTDAMMVLGVELAGALESLIPLLNKIVDLVKFLFEVFGMLPGPIKGTVLAMFALLAASGPVLLITGALIAAYGQLAIAMAGVNVASLVGGLNRQLVPALGRVMVQLKLMQATKLYGASGLWTGLKTIAVGAAGGIKGAMLGLVGVLKGALLSAIGVASAALQALWVLILANPLGAIAIAIGIVAVALSSFVFKEGGIFENYWAGTKETIDELRNSMTNLGDEVGQVGVKLADTFRETMPQITEAISEGVAAGKDMNEIIGELLATYKAGTAEGDALRQSMIDIGAEMNSVAREAAALKKKQEEQAAAAAAAVQRMEDMEAALESMGVITEEVAAAAIEELTLVMESGEAPARMMAEKMVELTAKLADLAAESPGVRDALNSLAAEMDQDALAAARLDAVLTSLGMVTVGAATDKIKQLSTAVESGAAAPDMLAGAFLDLQEELRELAESQPEVATLLQTLRDGMDEGAIAAEEYERAMEALGLTTETVALEGIDALMEIIATAGEPTAEMAAKFLEVEEALKLMAESSPAVQEALENARDVMGEEAIKAAELKEAIDALNLTALSDLETELVAIRAAFEAGAGSPKQLEDALEALKEKAEEFQDADLVAEIARLTAEMEAAAEASDLVVDPFKKFADVISDFGVKTLPDTLERLKDLPAAIRAGVIPTDQLEEIVKALKEELKELAKTEPEVAAALQKIADEAVAAGADIEDGFFDKLKEGFAGLTDQDNLEGFLGAGLDTLFSGDIGGSALKMGEDIVGQIGSGIGGAVGSVFGPLGSMIGSKLGGMAGKLVPLIAGLFGGEPEWKGIAKDIANTFGEEVSDELAQQIEKTSEELGNRAAAITQHLPDIIAEQGVKSAAALGTFVTAAQDNLAQLDAGVFTSGEAFGQLGEVLTTLIPEMDLVGATTENTNAIFGTLTESLNRVATGAATAADAQQLLGDTVPLLIERMDMMGAAGVQGMRSIIEQTRALGVEVEAVTEFVLKQTKKISDGVGAMTATLVKRLDMLEEQLPPGLGLPAALKEAEKFVQQEGSAIFAEIAAAAEEALPEIEAAGEDIAEAITGPLSRITPEMERALIDVRNQAMFAAGAVATAFSEMLAQGIPVTQIVSEIGPKLADLRGVFDRLGTEAPEAFKKISSFARKLGQEDTALVIEGVQGMGQAMQGLRDLGMATQADFSAFATTLGSSFDQLRDQGLTQKQTFAALAPQLQTLVDLQRDFGFEVDAATQALIDEASAQGVVHGAQLDTADAVSAGFEGMFQRFDAFLEKQGVATEGMFHFGDQATQAMESVSGATAVAADTMTNQFGTALTSVSTTATQAATDFSTNWTNAAKLSGEEIDKFKELTEQKLVEMGTTTEDVAASMSGAFEVSTEESGQHLENLKLAQQEALLEMLETGEITTQEMAAQFANIEEGGSLAFKQIANSAALSAKESLKAFEDMEDEMVENSIFPDTAKAAASDLSHISDAALIAAQAAEGAFQGADLSLTPGLGDGAAGGGSGFDAMGLNSTALTGLAGGTALGEINRTMAGEGEPGDVTVNLVVDGQVLAKTVIKNTPRALSNAGLNNYQR